MPVLTVEGTYRDGQIELAETPGDVREAHILVTFLPATEDAIGAQSAAADAARRQDAARRMFERMDRGIDFGGERFNREEIYEERMRELDERRARKR